MSRRVRITIECSPLEANSALHAMGNSLDCHEVAETVFPDGRARQAAYRFQERVRAAWAAVTDKCDRCRRYRVCENVTIGACKFVLCGRCEKSPQEDR